MSRKRKMLKPELRAQPQCFRSHHRTGRNSRFHFYFKERCMSCPDISFLKIVYTFFINEKFS